MEMPKVNLFRIFKHEVPLKNQAVHIWNEDATRQLWKPVGIEILLKFYPSVSPKSHLSLMRQSLSDYLQNCQDFINVSLDSALPQNQSIRGGLAAGVK
jgi:hypothetical protein